MKFKNFKSTLKDAEGNVAKDNDKEVMVVDMITKAIWSGNVKAEALSVKEVNDRGVLARKFDSVVTNEDEVELTTEEISKIKEYVSTSYMPFISFQIFEFFENN